MDLYYRSCLNRADMLLFREIFLFEPKGRGGGGRNLGLSYWKYSNHSTLLSSLLSLGSRNALYVSIKNKNNEWASSKLVPLRTTFHTARRWKTVSSSSFWFLRNLSNQIDRQARTRDRVLVSMSGWGGRGKDDRKQNTLAPVGCK